MANLIDYKCPNCGGALEFSSTDQQMKCPYCESTFPVEQFKPKDEGLGNQTPDDFEVDVSSAKWEGSEGSDFGLYRCSSCGAEIIADASTAATSCPYCSNNIILTGRLAGELKPDCIIPFKYSKKEAKEALEKHFSGKKLLPKVFTSENHLDEVKGVYVPYWIYNVDADADASYSMTKVRMWSDTRYNYTETSHYGAARHGSISFENIPADAASEIADDLTESLEAFDYSELTDFKTAYLSGFFANRYDLNSEKCLERVKERIKKSASDAFDATVSGYDSVSRTSENVRLTKVKARYALFPVWILNTTWRGKQYIFAMNGQTGKFVGNLPIDKWSYWWRRLLYTGLFGGLLYAAFVSLQFI